MLSSIYYVRSIVPGDKDGNLDLEGDEKVDWSRKDFRWRKQHM